MSVLTKVNTEVNTEINTEINTEAIFPVKNTNNICNKCWSDHMAKLTEAELDREYVIKGINTNDEELRNFLFTLGCYEGETVTLISVLSGSYVILVKDAKYSIDRDLAESILI